MHGQDCCRNCGAAGVNERQDSIDIAETVKGRGEVDQTLGNLEGLDPKEAYLKYGKF